MNEHGFNRQNRQRQDKRSVNLPNLVLTIVPTEFNRNVLEWSNAMAEAQLPPTQLRRFYGEVKRIQQLIGPVEQGNQKRKQEREARWKQNELAFRMLKAKAAYALRTDRNKREALVKYLQDAVDEVKTLDLFDNFLLHFEAVVGYVTPLIEKGAK